MEKPEGNVLNHYMLTQHVDAVSVCDTEQSVSHNPPCSAHLGRGCRPGRHVSPAQLMSGNSLVGPFAHTFKRQIVEGSIFFKKIVFF